LKNNLNTFLKIKNNSIFKSCSAEFFQKEKKL